MCQTDKFAASSLIVRQSAKGERIMTMRFPAHLTLTILICLTLFGTAMAVDIPKNSSEIPRITVAEFQRLQASGETVIIIDTRRSSQWQRAEDKIPGAIRVTTQQELRKLQSESTPDTEIVTYCT